MSSSFTYNIFSSIILSIFLTKQCLAILPVCDVQVVSGELTYKGCRKTIDTNSLDEPTNQTKQIYIFSGIPYAEKPIDSLRFKKPVQKTYRGKTFIDATKRGQSCMQFIPIDIKTVVPSEDCLFLNIWSQSLDNTTNLPVIIWIHGGGFAIGSGTAVYTPTLSLSSNYDGTLLALRDVVVVTLNYRLGVWGFLFGDSDEAPGNMGLWDQAMVIQWVIDNIKSFGGNPQSITLMGESAGSMSVSCHIVSNQTRNKFQRAILQSGTSFVKFAGRPKYELYSHARRYASNLSCNDNNTWISCLRSKTSEELLAMQMSALLWEGIPFYNRAVLFGPIFGDEFLPKSVNEAVREGDCRNDINIMTAHNEVEGALFAAIGGLLVGDVTYVPQTPIAIITKNKVVNDIKNVFIQNDTIGPYIADKYTQSFGFLDISLIQKTMRRAAAYSIGDFCITCPTILFGAHFAQNAKNSGKVFQYRLTYKPTQSFAAGSTWSDVTHADDSNLVFGIPLLSDALLWVSEDKKIAKDFLKFITYFAINGIPPEINGNEWPAYSIKSDNTVNVSYMEIHADDNRLGRVRVNQYRGPFTGFSSPFNSECFSFWEEIFNKQF